MSLLPLSLKDLKRLRWASSTTDDDDTPPWQQSRLPVTDEQLQALRGRTVADRMESTYRYATVAVGGLFFSYMLSLGGLGTFLPTVLGGMSTFWYFWGPRWQAAQRNFDWTQGQDIVGFDDQELEAEEDDGFLRAALYVGRVESASVVRQPHDSSSVSLQKALQLYDLDEEEDGEKVLNLRQERRGAWNVLRLGLVDRQGRRLQVHSQLLPRRDSFFLAARKSSLLACAILLSRQDDFQELAAMTDLCCFRLNHEDEDFRFVGDYPFLPQVEFTEWLQDKQEVDDDFWNLLQEEAGAGEGGVMMDIDNDRLADSSDNDNDDPGTVAWETAQEEEELEKDDFSWQRQEEGRQGQQRQDEPFGWQDKALQTRQGRQRYQEEEEEEDDYDDYYYDDEMEEQDQDDFVLEQEILRQAQFRDNNYIRKIFLSMIIILAGLVLVSDPSFI